MDIDNDQKSDQHIVRNLITTNGGMVDSWIDEKTGDRRGKITFDTRYLVLGKAPEASATGASGENDRKAAKAYSRMIDKAKEHGIQMIKLDDLLQRMGWKNQTPVIKFGRGANPNDFLPKPPDGGSKVSTGTVSDLFKPRRPPTGGSSKRGGAY